MGDMLLKLAQIGTPKETLWEMSGYFSPQQIARMKTQAADEALTLPFPTPVRRPKEPIPGGPQPAPAPGDIQMSGQQMVQQMSGQVDQNSAQGAT
jgi:hypothetical protein